MKIIEWLKKHIKGIGIGIATLISTIFVFVVFILSGRIIESSKTKQYEKKKDKLKERKDKDEKIIHNSSADSYNNDGTIK